MLMGMNQPGDGGRREFLLGLVGLAGVAGMERVAFAAGERVSGRMAMPEATVLFAGDEAVAYRDPAALYFGGWFYLYFTLVKKAEDGVRYSYVAWSRSRDLRSWSSPVTLTPRDKHLDFGSPGNVVRTAGGWLMCVQTYPRPNGEQYGNKDSRIWTMRSKDLKHWETPKLLRVKGPGVAVGEMGRMIDPFLLKDKDVKDKWWCLYKQNGISRSWSNDLKTWTYAGRTEAGENPCVIVDKGEYVLVHSPKNGIGVKRSGDLEHWKDVALLTLGQKDWAWAQGRITAGFVLDLRGAASVGRALMFFHGSRFPEEDKRGGFDNYASVGVAWSEDLVRWEWGR